VTTKKKILCIVGTRPEAIKMAPLILALKQQAWADVRVLATAQHREMLDQVLALVAITPDIDLNIMQPGQSLPQLTARLMLELDKTFSAEKPDIVLAQGDTTTVMMAALASFYQQIPFGHVEAGLRTGEMYNPFPEEMNRVIAGHLAQWHFAPTQSSRENLLREGIPQEKVYVTGNTVIDALLTTVKQEHPLGIDLDETKRLVLVTTHRRENFGEPLKNIVRAVKTLIENNPDIEVLLPVHPNPNVSDIIRGELGDVERIILCEPLDYAPFITAMKKAYLILTDSGGVQEEAPALAKPVLVLRSETERPEAIDEGVVKLVGTDYDMIVDYSQRLLDDEKAYGDLAKGVSPYGDGHAAQRIVDILAKSE
jgi:UDP-N-acetylglucosamine 2-epimerase (non-hydrolysing)